MRLSNLGACVLALLLASCGVESVTVEQQEMGSLQLPLTASSSSGKVYRLRGATFTITGPQTATLNGDTPEASVQTTLLAGAYTIQLVDGWSLEDTSAPGTAAPAQLLSPNPLPFFVNKGETAVVRFQFKLPGEGSADVGIKVDNGGWLAGTLHFTKREPSYGPPSVFDELVGKDVPFLISYETATYIKAGPYGGPLRVETGPVTLQFGGAPSAMLDRAASSLKGARIVYELMPAGPGGIVYMGRVMWYEAAPGAYIFDIGSSDMFQGSLDSSGVPAARPFEATVPDVFLGDSSYSGVRGTASLKGSP